MAEALTETVALLVQLTRAATTRAIYPSEHPSVAGSVAELLSAFELCIAKRRSEEVTFLVIDEDVVIDDRPMRTKAMYLRPFVRILSRLGIQRLTFARGLNEKESQQLLGALAGAHPVASSDHVVVGRVELGMARAGEGGGGRGGDGSLTEADLDLGGAAFTGVRTDRSGSIEQLDRLVWRVMEGLASSSRSLLLLAPVKSFDHYLFLHSINVSALTVAQARSLGIEGTALHEIGLASLLHDVGKLSLPESLWQKKGRLEGRSWEVAQLHPELGAAMLCGAEGVPPLAVLVAYEHHLRWDGIPSYPRCDRLPNLASQLTAVADTWDVMASGRGELVIDSRQAALKVWRERSGTVLDPFLVGNFILMMSEIGEGPI